MDYEDSSERTLVNSCLAHHMLLSTDALQYSDESFRTEREKSGSLCGIILLTKVIFGHHHIYWLTDDFSLPLTWEQGFYHGFSWITKWYIPLFPLSEKHDRNIHFCVCVCTLAFLGMNVMAHFPPCRPHLHCGSEQKVRMEPGRAEACRAELRYYELTQPFWLLLKPNDSL